MDADTVRWFKMLIRKPIILTEFPKSGGSWIVSMLGDALDLPRRDICVRPGFDLFNIRNHPWYQNASTFDFPVSSVIKSHELPESELIDFDAQYVHLVRDGRDVVVSKWFFDSDFCVQNKISGSLDCDFDKYVERTARLWSNYVNAWTQRYPITIHYEDFLFDPISNLGRLISRVSKHKLTRNQLQKTVAKFTKEKFSESLANTFAYNTFVRKGITGDWKNHFSEKNVAEFKMAAGETLVLLGYEQDLKWAL